MLYFSDSESYISVMGSVGGGRWAQARAIKLTGWVFNCNKCDSETVRVESVKHHIVKLHWKIVMVFVAKCEGAGAQAIKVTRWLFKLQQM